MRPIFTRDQRESHRRVARGEFPLYLPLTLPDMLTLKGLPVKAIIPPEGVPYVLYGNIVLKNAPHPNAAKLYIDFLQTREPQLVYARIGHGYVIDGIENEIPEDVRADFRREADGHHRPGQAERDDRTGAKNLQIEHSRRAQFRATMRGADETSAITALEKTGRGR